jgi:hypothetical protein
MSFAPWLPDSSDLPVLEHLLAGGTLVAAQARSPSHWSPERRLAGAVLAAALVEVREHHAKPSYRRAVGKDLEWIFSDDQQWPFSFVRLCQALGVEPDYVRVWVHRWVRSTAEPPSGNGGTPARAIRHASA